MVCTSPTSTRHRSRTIEVLKNFEQRILPSLTKFGRQLRSLQQTNQQYTLTARTQALLNAALSEEEEWLMHPFHVNRKRWNEVQSLLESQDLQPCSDRRDRVDLSQGFKALTGPFSGLARYGFDSVSEQVKRDAASGPSDLAPTGAQYCAVLTNDINTHQIHWFCLWSSPTLT